MNHTIEYEEVVRRINSVTIEVENEEKGEEVANTLYGKASGFNHPDDIYVALNDMGVNVVGTCKGAEECEYEIL